MEFLAFICTVLQHVSPPAPTIGYFTADKIIMFNYFVHLSHTTKDNGVATMAVGVSRTF